MSYTLVKCEPARRSGLLDWVAAAGWVIQVVVCGVMGMLLLTLIRDGSSPESSARTLYIGDQCYLDSVVGTKRIEYDGRGTVDLTIVTPNPERR